MEKRRRQLQKNWMNNNLPLCKHTIYNFKCKYCKQFQDEAYKLLEDNGFDDIEDTDRGGFEVEKGNKVDANHGGRPLKKWTGVSLTPKRDRGDDEYDPDVILDAVAYQPADSPIVSSFPQPIYGPEEKFLNNPEFHKLCKEAFLHGNSILSPEQVATIWELYSQGWSERKIAKHLGLEYKAATTTRRAILKMREWMNFLHTDAPEAETVEVVTRPYNPDTDAPLVYTTWRNNLWYDLKRPDSEATAFYRKVNRHIKKLLSQPSTVVRIACMTYDPNQIIGYSIMQGTHLIWVYVKANYRKEGIATLLCKDYLTVSEPETKIGQSIVKNKKLTTKEN